MENKEVVERVKLQEDLIPRSQAWFVALKEEVEALTDEGKIDEDKFSSFLDQNFNEIDEKLKELWEEWNEEQN